ncbi:IS3 family transposase [Allobaculum mucilyticum]|uniref:IS3 family transposase n=1 Tax=Allobaculum mucilyticum TaxID=2834459 RepID=UPI0030B85336
MPIRSKFSHIKSAHLSKFTLFCDGKSTVRKASIELETDTIIHSDQGCHYTSYSFIELVKSKRLRQSMSRKGNCWDNAPQESFFGHMKDDLKEHLSRQESSDRVVEFVSEWIQYYNTKRYQWQLAKLSPDQFYDYITTGEYPIEGIEPAPIRLDSHQKK